MSKIEPNYWNPLVPELCVTDLKTSLDFYSALGFEVRFRRDEPAFAYIDLGKAQIMLEQLHGVDLGKLSPSAKSP